MVNSRFLSLVEYRDVAPLIFKNCFLTILDRKQATTQFISMSNVGTSASPLPLPSAAEMEERNCKQVRAKLTLIEEACILQDDIEEKHSAATVSC